MSKYVPVIGLEIHVELATKSKMFCQCSANYFEKEPNTNTCPVCLGLPGALPVPNQKAIEWTIKIGQALGCKINGVSKFDRKHYFYADLPKGYQISQYDEPIASKGVLRIKEEGKREKAFGITRVHLEEDTGKLIHAGEDTLVDFNRSGVPLVEIVTEPDFSNSDDVKRFLEELQVIIRYLGVSDADMERGSMRLEPNISLRKIKHQKSKIKMTDQNVKIELPNYKVEVKNINSFKFVQRAIEYEIQRQTEILERGETPKQETRGFNETHMKTVSQRTKEEAHDYRYFPEPDIPPMTFSPSYIQKVREEIPELPAVRFKRFVGELKIKEADAFILTRTKKLADYFEDVIRLNSAKLRVSNQQIANLIVNKKILTTISPVAFAQKIGDLTETKQVDENKLNDLIKHLIKSNPKVVADYKKGRENAIMFLVGQVMREMKGQVDAKSVIAKIREQIQGE